MPHRVSVPLPALTSEPPVPVIALASVVLAALLVVSVPAPSAIVPPAPDSAPTVWTLPSEVEGAAVDCQRPGRRQRTATLSRNSVPALTVVPPV